MASEQWLARVARAQQMAADRLGVDVSVMKPPRSPGAEAEAEPTPVVEGVAAAPEEPAVVETVEESAAQTTSAASEEPAAAGAARIAEAKARAAAKASNGGGAASTAPPVAPATPRTPVVRAPTAVPDGLADEDDEEGISRREFLTYAWGGALGLITAQSGLATYFFMYPRFKAGEFGGKFILGSASTLPPDGATPDGRVDGKFWLVNTEEGPKALYMVCTHLGCLYKWAPENNRFECPCHGSKFTRDGNYIEGPAPRSLDQFLIEIVENGEVVSTTEGTSEAILAPSVPSPDAEIVVDTGKRIVGPSKLFSPANASLEG